MDEASGFVIFVFGARHVDQGDAVMFIVISDEGQVVVGVHDSAAEEVAVEAFHMIEACGFQHYVCEFGRGDDFVAVF